jgi:hypothetical protein
MIRPLEKFVNKGELSWVDAKKFMLHMSKHQALKSDIETNLKDWIELKKEKMKQPPSPYLDVYFLTNMDHIDLMKQRKVQYEAKMLEDQEWNMRHGFGYGQYH